jgi:hypothetical protein
MHVATAIDRYLIILSSLFSCRRNAGNARTSNRFGADESRIFSKNHAIPRHGFLIHQVDLPHQNAFLRHGGVPELILQSYWSAGLRHGVVAPHLRTEPHETPEVKAPE